MLDTNVEIDANRPIIPVADVLTSKSGEDGLLPLETEVSTSNSADPGKVNVSIATAECDYDINPTELYQAIESKQWEHAIRLLKSDGGNGKQSGADQAKVWVVRKERDGKLRWRMMPIHASIIFKAPYGIVEAILNVAPLTAQFKDDQGMLPLHLAFRNDATDEVIDELLAAYPNAIQIKDRKGRVPLLCGVSRGNANRWKLLGSYTALAVSFERQKMNTLQKEDLEKEMMLERKVQEEAMRLLKQQNELKLKEADDMVAAVVEEVKQIKVMSTALTEEMHGKTTREKSLEYELSEVRKEKKIFEDKILAGKHAAETSEVSSEVLVKYNSFIDSEKRIKEELKILEAQRGVGPSIPDELLEDTAPINSSNIVEKVKQLGQVLKDTEQKLKDEVGAKAHVQQKLEDTIDKQLLLTEELMTVKAGLEQAQADNSDYESHIEVTKKQVDEFEGLKMAYDTRIAELTTALKHTNKQLDTLMSAAAAQKTEVEASFAVRERMLQAIARQEADMVKAATERDEITDIARALKAEVETMLVKRSPLLGITNSASGSK